MFDALDDADEEAWGATTSLLQLTLQQRKVDDSHGTVVLLLALLFIVVVGCVIGLFLQDLTGGDDDSERQSMLSRLTSCFSRAFSFGTPDMEEATLDFPESVYGAMSFAIICSHPTGEHADKLDPQRRFRTCLCTLLLLGNYAIQAGLLFLASHYVVTPTIAHAQSVFATFHREYFSKEGVFDPAAFSKWPEKADLCNLVYTFTSFNYVILVVWFLRMGNELRDTVIQAHVFWDLEGVDSAEKQVRKDDSDDSLRVIGLTTFTRGMILSVILLPKFCISVVLFLLGTFWLISTTGLSEVIINVVALEFILSIDEIMFTSLVPRSIRGDLVEAKIQFLQAATDNIIEYIMSIVFIIVLVVLPFIFLTWGQDLPGVGLFPGFVRSEVVNACRDFLEHNRQTLCSGGGPCFPYGGR